MDFKLLDLPTKEIYQDLFKPGLENAGKALATVLDVSNLILLPLKLLNDRSKVYFEHNIERYSQKLKQKSETNILTVVPEIIGLPVVDKLTYMSKTEVAEAFLNLLTKASFEETLELVHPSYINILETISTDEAKILFYLKDLDSIPYINIYLHKYKEVFDEDYINDENLNSHEKLKRKIEFTFQERENVEIKHSVNMTGIENDLKLDFPNNMTLYLENLIFKGLLRQEKLFSIKDEKRFDNLINNIYRKEIQKANENVEEVLKELEDKTIRLEIDIRKNSLFFTELGKQFIKCCILD